jgi:hypothetical protein
MYAQKNNAELCGAKDHGRRAKYGRALISAVAVGVWLGAGTRAGYAASATWSATAGSTDYLDPNNWSPNTVPNGASDTASFGVSTQTTVNDTQVSVLVQLNGITFNAGASAYTITGVPGGGYFITGTGVVNNSTTMQNFVAPLAQNAGSQGAIFLKTALQRGTT